MNAFSPKLRLLICVLGATAVFARADEPAKPDQEGLRAAVTRGLAFLDKEADTWMNERTCNGCHHMPELLWSHREAQRRGFPIDQKTFGDFVDWSSSRGKSGPTEMLAFLKLAMPDKAPPELTSLILKSQQPDGSWKEAGQFDGQKRSTTDAKASTTRLALLAPGTPGTSPADPATLDEARTKAADFLAKNEPVACIDSFMYRALYARRFGPPEDVSTNRAEILKLQHSDGGWSFIVGEEMSDPLGTGQALYALRQSPDAASAEAVARGQTWLVTQQREDGEWNVDLTRISKNPRSGPEKAKSFKDATMIYTFWGSAWATIGLVQEFPVVKKEE